MPTLKICLVRITNLKSGGEMMDDADPYVKFELMQDNSIFVGDVDYGMKQSSKKKDEEDPIYNEHFEFEQIEEMNNMELKVTVMDDDVYSSDDKLGSVTINLEELDLDPEPILIRKRVIDRIFEGESGDSWIALKLSWGEEVVDDEADELSHVGQAAYECLRTKHFAYHHELWNVTNGRVIGAVHQTPIDAWPGHPSGGEDGHDDWFPEKMAEIVSRTQRWCDVLSLGPPDGKFMVTFKDAIAKIAATADDRTSPVTIRMCFGNIPAMPTNCTKIIEELTDGIDPDSARIKLWVGAWRRVSSWNHAKILAVDGRHLHTGGHNLWDPHYLEFDPIHDLSLEMEGKVAIDGHNFANEQWDFIESKQETFWGGISDRLPDGLPQTTPCRVTVSEWPAGRITQYPPPFRPQYVKDYGLELRRRQRVPIITMGRYGSLTKEDRPSDDAFVAMFLSAEKSIKCALQDLGPVCIPGTKKALPGLKWPKPYLSAFGKVIWEKGVDVEIALSNPSAIPAGLSPLQACYGNGWTCDDVCSEIIKTIREQYPDAEDGDLRQKVSDNLRVCFIREGRGNRWEDDMVMGLHSKHFIIDDTATYIGSQNLYVCDLAEWGVVIDDPDQTAKMMDEYWNPLWECSFTGEDVDVDAVMDGLDIDRDGGDPDDADEETLDQMEQANMASFGCSANDDMYDSESSVSDASDGSDNSRKAKRRRRKEKRRAKKAERKARRRRNRRRGGGD